MGDHRASIKCQVSMHGVEDSCDMWINWFEDSSDCCGIDQRVVDFFRNWAIKARQKYDDEQWEAQEEKREREERERELAELARLKAKYEKPA